MDTLCKIRDMYRAIAEFEIRFEKAYQLGLNEGMLLCWPPLGTGRNFFRRDCRTVGVDLFEYIESNKVYGKQGLC